MNIDFEISDTEGFKEHLKRRFESAKILANGGAYAWKDREENHEIAVHTAFMYQMVNAIDAPSTRKIRRIDKKQTRKI